jgi:hypothetical protein
VIDVYAITGRPAPTLPDVDHAMLQTAGASGLTVVWAPAPERPAEVTIDALRRHEAIVEALMDACDLLPVRFGTRVPDVATATRLLIERRDELTGALARVAGAVELAVRVAAAPGAAVTTGYALAAVHRPLARKARATAQHRAAGDDLLRGAYLVERDRVQSFVAAVAELQDDRPELRLLCTGPWPPYSFTD